MILAEVWEYDVCLLIHLRFCTCYLSQTWWLSFFVAVVFCAYFNWKMRVCEMQNDVSYSVVYSTVLMSVAQHEIALIILL
jgi:hypothetical protein